MNFGVDCVHVPPPPPPPAGICPPDNEVLIGDPRLTLAGDRAIVDFVLKPEYRNVLLSFSAYRMLSPPNLYPQTLLRSVSGVFTGAGQLSLTDVPRCSAQVDLFRCGAPQHDLLPTDPEALQGWVVPACQ